MWRVLLLVAVSLLGVSAHQVELEDLADRRVGMEDLTVNADPQNRECLSSCCLEGADRRVSANTGSASALKYYLEPGGGRGDLLNPYPLGYFNDYMA